VESFFILRLFLGPIRFFMLYARSHILEVLLLFDRLPSRLFAGLLLSIEPHAQLGLLFILFFTLIVFVE
jgi:hypothetical protein